MAFGGFSLILWFEPATAIQLRTLYPVLCTTKYKMKIFNSQALKELDLATCEAQDIDSIQLMERAAEAVSLEVISRFLPRQRIVVIAGPGNNGGDALAVARLLIEQGYKKVEVFLFNVGGKLSHDCDEERKKLITIEGVDFTEVRREFNPPYLDENDVVIDGLSAPGCACRSREASSQWLSSSTSPGPTSSPSTCLRGFSASGTQGRCAATWCMPTSRFRGSCRAWRFSSRGTRRV